MNRFQEDAKSLPNLTTSTGKAVRCSFDAGALKRKFEAFRSKYDAMKKKHKVSRHMLAGETGAANEGQPQTAQAAIDAATAEWDLFTQFDQAFGDAQRLRDDTFAETISPAKPIGRAGPAPTGPNIGATQASASARRVRQLAGAKRRRASAASDPAASSGDDRETVHEAQAAADLEWCSEEGRDKEDPDVSAGSDVVPARATAASRPSSAAGARDSDGYDSEAGGKAARSRRSARDMHLASALSDSRMTVALRAAELKEATAKTIMGMSLDGKKEAMKQQDKIAERRRVAQREEVELQIAAADRATDVHRSALEVQKAGVDVQREKYKSTELMTLTQMYVTNTEMGPGAALLQAKQDLGIK